MNTILVTGGAGFIGSEFVHVAIAKGWQIVNLDVLSYAGNPANLADLSNSPAHVFVEGSINDRALVASLLDRHQPVSIANFAAETHVDRSIDDPAPFVRTNVDGTFELLEAVRRYWSALDDERRAAFRFLHVSTDEVYGSTLDGLFRESSPYAPNSPYAASKAAADHLVRSYNRTYGLPTLITNCGNNYGPRQFPEKLIPHMIVTALQEEPLPVYGDGQHVRDWLYVTDHCAALLAVLREGRLGETYNVGGRSESTNLALVERLCGVLDELSPRATGTPHAALITFVPDRPGHDRRYALDTDKIGRDVGWSPAVSLEEGLRTTVSWYLQHRSWWMDIRSGAYRGERLGLGAADRG